MVVLIVGEPSAACDALLKFWEDEAHEDEFNFCAIEAGDAAEPNAFLTDLLCSHVPLDTCIYIVQRDSEVPGEELKRVQDLLDQLQISVATIQPLLATEYDHWVAASGELRNPAEAELEHSGIGECGNASFHPNEIQQQNCAAAAVQLPSMPSGIVKAFNQLQFTPHWQAAASTRGAKVLCQLLGRIRLENAVEPQGQSALETVLTAMTHDQAMLESVLSAAAQWPVDSNSLALILWMYLACMEQRVASGTLDAQESKNAAAGKK